MAHYFPGVAFVFLTVLSRSAESCLPQSIQASVPQNVKVGYVISRVNLDQCRASGLVLTSSDPGFMIRRDGSIVTHRLIRVPPQGKTFSIWIQDQNGGREKIEVCLSQRKRKVGSKVQNDRLHRRFKRRWSPMPFLIQENEVSFPRELERIGSDTSQNYSVYYMIHGPGVTEKPQGVFSVHRESGMLQVNKAVDREQFPVFKFTATVINRFTLQDTDKPLTITVIVQDVNDNKPQFSGLLQFSVPEKSLSGTVVGRVNATDADEPNTDHSKIKYTLLSGGDLFAINPATGVISTRTATLDREVQEKHFVTVVTRDLNGASNGLSNTATATISLKDINDNPPVFKETAYNVKIQENEAGRLLLRIPVDDKDLKPTPNWKALFMIPKGNENGNFKIETDPKTNEGLLYITKPLDYEKTKTLKLEVLAKNEAPLSGTTANFSSIPVDLTVVDVDEGPEFAPPILVLWVKENRPNGTVIGTYTATDPETKSSVGMRYSKVSDPASWINVVESTGELKIANTVDRESVFVKNGMYNITVKAVHASSKSGTGSVIIHVQDENDNTPNLVGGKKVLCEKRGELGSVLVLAEDKDEKPFSDPFTFNLAGGNDGKWMLKDINGTSAVLQLTRELQTGLYSVPLEIIDQQGAGGMRMVTISICHCQNGACPAPLRSIALGVWGILIMLLGLALLLLLCIFSAMACVTKAEKFDIIDGGESSGMLLKSNTEALGDAVTSDIIVVPSSAVDQSVKGSLLDGSHPANSNTVGAGIPLSTQRSFFQQSGEAMVSYTQDSFSRGIYKAGTHFGEGRTLKFMDPSSMSTWKSNGMFLDQKLKYFLTEEDGRYADDILSSYGFEGEGSPAGSVGCCSEQGVEEDLEFLNTLGPKFRTLAEICTQ